jgi:hypothetical protein
MELNYKNNRLRLFAFLLTSSKIFGRYWLISISFLLAITTPLAPFFWVCTTILMLETILHLLVLFQVKSIELLYYVQDFLHRFAPMIYEKPLPLHTETKYRNSEFRQVSQVIELLPIESRREITTVSSMANTDFSHYWNLDKTKNGKYLLTIDEGTEEVSKEQIQSRLRANKNRQNPDKPSPKIQSYIDLYTDVLAEMDRIEKEQKQLLNRNFTNDLDKQLNDKEK